MYLRLHYNSTAFPQRRRSQQLQRIGNQNKGTSICVICSPCDNMYSVDCVSLWTCIWEAKYFGVYLCMLIDRLIDCHEL